MKFGMKELERNIILAIVICAFATCVGYSFAYFTSGNGTGKKDISASGSATTAKFIDISYNKGQSQVYFQEIVLQKNLVLL